MYDTVVSGRENPNFSSCHSSQTYARRVLSDKNITWSISNVKVFWALYDLSVYTTRVERAENRLANISMKAQSERNEWLIFFETIFYAFDFVL